MVKHMFLAQMNTHHPELLQIIHDKCKILELYLSGLSPYPLAQILGGVSGNTTSVIYGACTCLLTHKELYKARKSIFFRLLCSKYFTMQPNETASLKHASRVFSPRQLNM